MTKLSIIKINPVVEMEKIILKVKEKYPWLIYELLYDEECPDPQALQIMNFQLDGYYQVDMTTIRLICELESKINRWDDVIITKILCYIMPRLANSLVIYFYVLIDEELTSLLY